ncbi:MAG: GDSL-type esterase/lipase family protein [Thermodesulfobacteriota bacterium]|nr:GDSL-type esterase/lipase family protein [Thermodesulfobacteriota bacterium]
MKIFFKFFPNIYTHLILSVVTGFVLGSTAMIDLSHAGNGPTRVVSCLGDSITNGFPYASTLNTYPERLLSALEASYGDGSYTVINHGINGYRADQILADLQNLNWMANDNPDLVLLMVGGNDLSQETNPDGSNFFEVITRTVAEVQAIIDLVTNHINPDGSNPQINVSAFIPNNISGVSGSLAISLYNNSLKNNLTGADLWFTDNWDDFYDPDTVQAKTSLMFDNIHPNIDGYAVMSENWFETIPPVPTAKTGSVTSVTSQSAILNGMVKPNCKETTYYFEYGHTKDYGYETESLSAGSGAAFVSVSTNIVKLIPNTAYHYRIVAINSAGASNGYDRSFIARGRKAMPWLNLLLF